MGGLFSKSTKQSITTDLDHPCAGQELVIMEMKNAKYPDGLILNICEVPIYDRHLYGTYDEMTHFENPSVNLTTLKLRESTKIGFASSRARTIARL